MSVPKVFTVRKRCAGVLSLKNIQTGGVIGLASIPIYLLSRRIYSKKGKKLLAT